MDDEEEGEGRGAKVLQTYRQTYIYTDPPTKRVLEEHSLLKKKTSYISFKIVDFEHEKTDIQTVQSI